MSNAMNLRITESCLALGQHAEAGTILKNVDKHVAADLLANRRAVIVSDPAIEHRDPEPVENRDPAPPARKAKTK